MSTDTRELAERLTDYADNAERINRIPTGSKYPHDRAGVLTWFTVEEARTIAAALRSPVERGEGEPVQACPVCFGRGTVPYGFYGDVYAAASSAAVNLETCRTCRGTTVYPPPLASPPAPVEGPNHLDREEWAGVDLDTLPPPLPDADRDAILARVRAKRLAAPVEGEREPDYADIANRAQAVTGRSIWPSTVKAILEAAALPVQGEPEEDFVDRLMSAPVTCPDCGFVGTPAGPYHDCKGGPAPAPQPEAPLVGPTSASPYSMILDRLERYTPNQRAEVFYRAEQRWCWDCGREQTECEGHATRITIKP